MSHNLALAMMPLKGTAPELLCWSLVMLSMAWRRKYSIKFLMADHLRRNRPAYLMTMDNDLADEGKPRKWKKAVSGKLQTADNTVVNQITWPHELIYMSAGQPAVYEDLSPMMFVNGYLERLVRVDQDMRVHMLSHLQELMADGEAYGWLWF